MNGTVDYFNARITTPQLETSLLQYNPSTFEVSFTIPQNVLLSQVGSNQTLTGDTVANTDGNILFSAGAFSAVGGGVWECVEPGIYFVTFNGYLLGTVGNGSIYSVLRRNGTDTLSQILIQCTTTTGLTGRSGSASALVSFDMGDTFDCFFTDMTATSATLVASSTLIVDSM